VRPLVAPFLQAPERRDGPLEAVVAAVTAAPDLLVDVAAGLAKAATRDGAVRALARLETRARPAAAALARLLADPDVHAVPVCEALVAVDARIGDVVPHLLADIEELEDVPAGRVQPALRGADTLLARAVATLGAGELDTGATWLLGRAASVAAHARGLVEQRLAKELRNPMLAWAIGPRRRHPALVQWALARIVAPFQFSGTPRKRPTVEELRAQLKHPDAHQRSWAATEASDLKRWGAPLVPDLIDLSRDTAVHGYLCPAEAAVYALGALGAHAAAAVPRLISIVENAEWPEHTQLPEVAIEALGRIGTASAPALPLLCRVLDDGSPGRRALARWAIARIVGER
jgi:hypothetical protein